MSAKVTYKTLYTQVDEQIQKSIGFNINTPIGQQVNTAGLAMANGGAPPSASADSQALVAAVQLILQQALPQRIINGLLVKATNPISNTVIVTAGSGCVGGTVYTLADGVALTIPFDAVTNVYYINLFNNTVQIAPTGFGNALTIAKIVVPNPSVTGSATVIQDKDDGTDVAFIVEYQTVNFYADENGIFEEDTLELFRNNIGQILADNLIGNIELSENLTITNVTGSLSFDSTSMQILDGSANQLALFNQNGVYFYDTNGIETARFTNIDSRIGNIVVTTNSLQSGNFSAGFQGFRIQDNGNSEFNNLIVRGTVFATGGSIGGFTITSNKLYGGTIQTAALVGAGQTGVVMDSAGLRGYDVILGQTFNLPTNGSAPTFASGIINSTVFNITQASVIQTSSTVGSGLSNSAGILINSTGLYGCGPNQVPSTANLIALINGNVSMTGTIIASAGQIGNVTIGTTGLFGGLIQGSTIIGSTIQTSSTVPRIVISSTGIYYQLTTNVGTYGTATSGGSGFHYGSGTKYGTGASAYLLNSSFPPFSVTALIATQADFRMYNRSNAPVAGTQQPGDLICVNNQLQICTAIGTPGTFSYIPSSNGVTGGSASAGAGKQYVKLNINGTNYHLLHDGTG